MTIKPAKRFSSITEAKLGFPGGSFRLQIKDLIEDFERKRIKWYRLMGADLPLTGHRNRALREILIQVLNEGWDYYLGETDCLHDFKEAVTIYERRNHGIEYSPMDIIATTGAAGGWHTIQNAILDPGDELVVVEPAHYISAPADLMYYLGAKIVQVPMIEEEKWELDGDALRRAVNSRTKAIVIDHPNNPTGHIYTDKEQKEIINIAGENDIPIISDELYRDITFDGNEAPSMAAVSGDVPTIILTSLSKFFMLPGWRMGYMAFHDPEGRIAEVRKVCTRLAETYGHATRGIALPILVATTRAFLLMRRVHHEISCAQDVKSPMDESMLMLKELQERRDYSFKRISEINGMSVVNAMATLYMFPKVEGIGKIWKTNEDFLLALIKEEQVGFMNGMDYGVHGFGHFRTLFIQDINVLEEVYNRLDRFIKRHIKNA